VPSIKYTFDPFEGLDIPSPSDYGSNPLQAPDDPEEDENLSHERAAEDIELMKMNWQQTMSLKRL